MVYFGDSIMVVGFIQRVVFEVNRKIANKSTDNQHKISLSIRTAMGTDNKIFKYQNALLLCMILVPRD